MSLTVCTPAPSSPQPQALLTSPFLFMSSPLSEMCVACWDAESSRAGSHSCGEFMVRWPCHISQSSCPSSRSYILSALFWEKGIEMGSRSGRALGTRCFSDYEVSQRSDLGSGYSAGREGKDVITAKWGLKSGSPCGLWEMVKAPDFLTRPDRKQTCFSRAG